MAKKKAKRGRPKKKEKKFNVNSEETAVLFAIIFLIAAGVSLVSIFVDAPYFDYIHRYLGWGVPVAAIFFGLFSLKLFGYESKYTTGKILSYLVILFLILVTLLHSFLPYDEALEQAEKGNFGGMIGYGISNVFVDVISRWGTIVVLTPLLVLFISLASGFSLLQFKSGFVSFLKFLEKILMGIMNIFRPKEGKKGENDSKEEMGEKSSKMVGQLSGMNKIAREQQIKMPVSEDKKGPQTSGGVDLSPTVVSEGDYSNWELPPVDLLNNPPKQVDNTGNHQKNKNIIEQTLDSFGVQARVTDVAVGPTVTQYALDIAMGVKVSRIKNLAGDLALALAAPSGAVRIEAPIPGTSLVGIEVPNEKAQTVTIKEIVDSPDMKDKKTALPMVLGKNIAGKKDVMNLAKMPHLLIAGSTGSGKSVTINAFLMSLLMSKSPAELRLILVDPKMVELSLYNGIPHLLTPVITDMDKVINSLKWAVAEMSKRYQIFKQTRVRNLADYNELESEESLPYIVIVIDEMADLMMQAGTEVEGSIVRLAQMARATGIHLILATQRPSVNVLTGLIKANIPARVGMSVATAVDSRVILDQIGAETLLGNGDMLYKAPDKNRMHRIQGAWVDPAEIERVVKFIKEQAGDDVEYKEDVVAAPPEAKVGSSYAGGDELFEDSIRIVVAEGKASASMLQRKMRIGYNRAARLIDELEDQGVLGPANGVKPRDVLISDADAFLGSNDEEAQEDF